MWRVRPGFSFDLSIAVNTGGRFPAGLASSDRELADGCFHAAWNIARVWAREPHCRPRLRARWRARAAKLRPDTGLSSRVVTFPETVALAGILADPDWLHHVATVPARQAGQFYQRVSARLGEGTYHAPAAYDPLIAWAQHHRTQFTDAPEEPWMSERR